MALLLLDICTLPLLPTYECLYSFFALARTTKAIIRRKEEKTSELSEVEGGNLAEYDGDGRRKRGRGEDEEEKSFYSKKLFIFISTPP